MRAGSTREGCLNEGWVDEGEMVVVAVQQALGLGHHRRRCRRLLLEDDLLSLQIYVPRPCICTCVDSCATCMWIDMCKGTWIDMCKGMCKGMCTDMCNV